MKEINRLEKEITRLHKKTELLSTEEGFKIGYKQGKVQGQGEFLEVVIWASHRQCALKKTGFKCNVKDKSLWCYPCKANDLKDKYREDALDIAQQDIRALPIDGE